MRWAAPALVALIAIFSAVNRIHLTRGLDHFDPANGDCLFWTEGAVQFRYARIFAEGGAIPEPDTALQSPDGLSPRRHLCLLMERCIGESYRRLAYLFGRPPLHVWAAYAPHLVSALGVAAAYIAALAAWGGGAAGSAAVAGAASTGAASARAAVAGLLAAALYAFSLATTARSIGSFGHEDFALPFLFLSAAFLMKTVRDARPEAGSPAHEGRTAFSARDGAVTAAMIAIALGAWHFSRFAHLMLVAALGWRIVTGGRDARRAAARGLAWLTAGAAAAGIAFSVLRESAFLISPQMLLSGALLAVAGLESRVAWLAAERSASNMTGARATANRVIVVLALFAPAFLVSSRLPAESAGYGHVYALFLDKLRFLGRKPADPSLLDPEARSLWIEDFASPSLYLVVVMFAAPWLLGVAAAAHVRAALRRRSERERGRADDPAAPRADSRDMMRDAAHEPLALLIVLVLISGAAFLLVKRLFVLHAFFACVFAGGAVSWALAGVARERTKARAPRVASARGREASAGASADGHARPAASRPRPRPVATALILVALAFEGHKITHHGGDTPVTAAIARVLKKPKPLVIPNWHANDLATVAWIRARTEPGAAFVARIGTSPMVSTYADRSIALQPKYEVPGIRERARAFDAALYADEAAFYRFCRDHRAEYYLHEPRAALEFGPDSERYVACATRLPKSSAAFRLQFAGTDSRYFEPLYRNVSYCVYRVRSPQDTLRTVERTAILPDQPIYEIGTFGDQRIDGEFFDDASTPGVIARTEEAIALLVRGQDELATRRLPNARAFFERAHAINPSLIGLNTYLGLSIAMMGDYAAALPYCERELPISPDLALAYANLGFVEGNLGRYDDARAHLTHALRLDPGNPGPQAMLDQVEAAALSVSGRRSEH
jgi:tetratricopeptide (TPR) repeat protein